MAQQMLKKLCMFDIGVADYESDVSFLKFKMADPIWRTIFRKFNVIRLKLVIESAILNFKKGFRF